MSIEKFQYMAHVRTVHTEGMALATSEMAGDGAEQEYSLVISPRSGPVDNTAPVTMSAHLISLDGIQQYIGPDRAADDVVGLVSLFSWTYQSLPSRSCEL